MDEETMRARVERARVARLATVTVTGRPHIVPCCFALTGTQVYSAVDGKPKTTLRLQRLANIVANPSASLLVDHYEEEWSMLWWVRLDGGARLVDDGPERDRAIELLSAKYSQYDPLPPPGPVLVLDIENWRGWP